MELDKLDVWIVQLCHVCGEHSRSARTTIEILSQGWVLLGDIALCPKCKEAMYNLIREKRRATDNTGDTNR